jgi:hypothetical protein
MLSVKGIYDGERIHVLEKPPGRKKYKVVITFLEEIDDDEELRTFTSQSEAFSFWNDKREDIYQDLFVKRS